MGQWEILDYLKENKDEWCSSQDISDNMSAGRNVIQSKLKMLRNSKIIDYRKILKKDCSNGPRHIYQYKHKELKGKNGYK